MAHVKGDKHYGVVMIDTCHGGLQMPVKQRLAWDRAYKMAEELNAADDAAPDGVKYDVFDMNERGRTA